VNAQDLALIVAALWLGVLSVLSLQVVKALGAVMLRLQGLGSSAQGEGVGPSAGESLSDATTDLLAGRGVRQVVVLLSTTCAACLRVAGLLAEEWHSQAPLTVAVEGDVGVLDEALRSLPAEIVVRSGLEGAAIYRELSKPPAPYVVVLAGSQVIGTGLLSDGLGHLWRLLELTEDRDDNMKPAFQTGTYEFKGGSL
jgi:hypothetical protein